MTGSVTGIMGSKDLLDYSMTKGGIHAFTRSLATHLVDAASGSTRLRRGRSGRRSTRPTRRPKRVAKFGSAHADEAAGSARGDRAGLRVPGRAVLLELHHRRSASDHRRLFVGDYATKQRERSVRLDVIPGSTTFRCCSATLMSSTPKRRILRFFREPYGAPES